MKDQTLTQKILTQEQLKTILRQFLQEHRQEFGLTALGYFGSYARQDAQPDSDVDIVFKTCRPNLLTTIRLRSTLSDRLNHPVDVVRLHPYLSPGFRERLQREAIYV